MKQKNIRFNMMINAGLPLVSGYILVFILLHFVLSSLNSLWLHEAETLFLDKYRQELKSTTELAVSLLETIYSAPDLTDEEKLEEARRVIRPVRFGKEGYFYVYEKGNGINVIHGSNPSLEGKSLWDLQDPEKTQYIIRELDRIAEGNTVFHEFFWTKLNSDKLYPKLGTAMAVPGTRLWVGTGAYTDDMEQELMKIKGRIEKRAVRFEMVLFSILLVIALASLFLLGTLSQNLSRPVIDLRNLLIESGGRDFTRRGEYSERRKSREVQELYNAINTIFDEFSRIVGQTKDNTASARTMSRQLAVISSSSSRNVEGMNTKLTELSKDTDRLHGDIGDSSRTAKDFQNYIGRVDSLVSEQVAALEESSAAVEQMIGSINHMAQGTEERNSLASELADTSEKGRKEMNASISNMRTIAQSTEEIGGMINIINDLAERTNLLAMNAAIEAAHAGSSGGGFAVIAQEIRSLSVNSSQNARSISDSLQSITSQIKESEKRTVISGEYFTAMVDGIREISQGLLVARNAIHETVTGGQQLTEAIRDLRGMGSQVSDASGEAKKQIDEISGTFSSIENIADKTNRELAAVAVELESIVESMTDLTSSGNENDRSLSLLEENLSVFRIREEEPQADSV